MLTEVMEPRKRRLAPAAKRKRRRRRKRSGLGWGGPASSERHGPPSRNLAPASVKICPPSWLPGARPSSPPPGGPTDLARRPRVFQCALFVSAATNLTAQLSVALHTPLSVHTASRLAFAPTRLVSPQPSLLSDPPDTVPHHTRIASRCVMPGCLHPLADRVTVTVTAPTPG